eukprot:gene14395-10370_t
MSPAAHHPQTRAAAGGSRPLSSPENKKGAGGRRPPASMAAAARAGQGQLDFFHRCVFAAFDPNGDGFDAFLDIFYKEGSAFAGDGRLPEKGALRERAYAVLDTNNDGLLAFHELQSLIT